MAKEIGTLDEISGGYDAMFCDVWGVVHNGVEAFPDAGAALARARAAGKVVILVTNSPRPGADVAAQLDIIGVRRDAWDDIVSSGDVTRDLIAEGPRRVVHLGPDRDLPLFDGLDIDLVEEFEASAVVCTGLVDDETEVPDDYSQALRRFRARDLPFICANPDIVVERGERLIWCAGALARDYALLGGRTLIAGKPHRPIYVVARAKAEAALARATNERAILAIGDGVLTDVKGAADFGLDALYVSGGIHLHEYSKDGRIDADALASFLHGHGFSPVASIPRLR